MNAPPRYFLDVYEEGRWQPIANFPALKAGMRRLREMEAATNLYLFRVYDRISGQSYRNFSMVK